MKSQDAKQERVFKSVGEIVEAYFPKLHRQRQMERPDATKEVAKTVADEVIDKLRSQLKSRRHR